MIDPETEYPDDPRQGRGRAGHPRPADAAAADAHPVVAVRYSTKAVKDLVRTPDAPARARPVATISVTAA